MYLLCNNTTVMYALTSSNINRFSKFHLLVLLPVLSGVITVVTGILSTGAGSTAPK